jgi:CheY-like chemotaxis protein
MKPSINALDRSVLVVNNEAETIERARLLLEKEGFAVAVAQSGETALKMIEDEKPSLVLTDISLPNIGGLETLEAMREHYPDTPVILITGTADLDAARTAVQKGAFHYLQKPWAAEDLVMICRRAAETLQLRVENKMLKQQTMRDLTVASPWLRPSSRPERAAMERAALVRVGHFVGDAISKTSTRVLEQALGESAPSVALTDLLAEVLLEDAADGEWAAALLRGAQVQRDLLRNAGGGLSASEVGTLLGIGRAAVDKRRRQGALFGLRLPNGDVVYPAAQFRKGDVVPGLAEVLGAFRIHDPWMQLDMLLAPEQALSGRTAFEALGDGDVQSVKTVVSSTGDQGL